jgi:DNA repair exonuclease SbcCD nuclease subunit
MRILIFSDIHLDAVTAGNPRKQEVVEFLRHVQQAATAHEVDLVIFSGDAHDSGWLLDPLYTAELIWGLLSFKQDVIAVAGNHDVVDTSELFDGEPVTTLTPLRVASKFTPQLQRRCFVADRPKLVKISAKWAVLCLPYVSRVHSKVSGEWLEHAVVEAAEFGQGGGKLIVVGHRVVPGAVMGSESAEMAKGQDQMFPFAEVAQLQPAVVINGHYHARQVVRVEGLEVNIPGAPLQFTFGETEEPKGVTVMQL